MNHLVENMHILVEDVDPQIIRSFRWKTWILCQEAAGWQYMILLLVGQTVVGNITSWKLLISWNSQDSQILCCCKILRIRKSFGKRRSSPQIRLFENMNHLVENMNILVEDMDPQIIWSFSWKHESLARNQLVEHIKVQIPCSKSIEMVLWFCELFEVSSFSTC